MPNESFQDQLHGNHCWGCGTLNPHGLKIKSYWSGAESVCKWKPPAHYMAGPRHVLNGGIIATVIDCHCVCTAIAAAYREEGCPIGSDPSFWYVTGAFNIKYLLPTAISEDVVLRAKIKKMTKKKTILTCSLISGNKKCVEAELVAVRVPASWSQKLEFASP